jgi:hypothetical protein
MTLLSITSMCKKIVAGVLVIFLFQSCVITSQSYYLSPQNANSNPYHTIPLLSDSIKGATYGSFVFTTGSANYQGSDYLSTFQASIYRSNNFGRVQAYYGANFTLGVYHIGEFYNIKYRYDPTIFGPISDPVDTIYHIPATRSTFGSYGVSGGINYVIPFSKGEWRAIGVETSMQNEFGNYSAFRNGLPDTAATIVFKQRFTGTIAVFTDLLWRDHHRNEWGFKFALGEMINPQSNYTINQTVVYPATSTTNIFPLSYFSTAFHMSNGPYAGFIQLNLGTYATSFQVGASYRLGKK